jgi:hypothetical protein
MAGATTAIGNTAIGYRALEANQTGAENVVVGNYAGIVMTGADNVAVGASALTACVAGARNVAVGKLALDSITSGGNNIGIGYVAGDAMTEAAGAVVVGYNGGQGASTAHQQVAIGFETNSSNIDGQVVIGGSVTAASSSTRHITIGYGSDRTFTTPGTATWQGTSDIRLKESVADHTLGLGFVNALRPVTFNWKKEKDVDAALDYYKEDSNKRVNTDGENAMLRHGFIAQEMKTVMDNNSLSSDSFNLWMELTDGTQSLALGELIPILVKALQEADNKIDALTTRITALEE